MATSDRGPVRILHVVGGMNRGGVETWLMHVLRHIDRERFRMDFLVHTEETCAYDGEIRALGSRILPCLHPSRPWAYARGFGRVLRACGPYDVVHSHVHHYSGYVLRLAARAGVPIRIAHSHNDTSPARRGVSPWRRGYLALAERWIRDHATVSLAASRLASEDLFGRGWEKDARCRLLYYGIDLEPFRNRDDARRKVVRRELGLPRDAFVVGHVGRFDPQKNHAFLLDIFAEVARREPAAYLLLVGGGLLRGDIERKARDLGLSSRVVFAGVRADVPRLMTGAMDVFVLPSLYEGLPLVLLEAQAAGLACVVSGTVSGEVDAKSSIVERLSLAAAPSAWAAATARLGHQPKDPGAALSIMASSPFTIEASLARLEAVYSA